MFVEGKSRTVFLPSDTLIYGISCDGSKHFNIRTCEFMILGQLSMGARQAKNAPLPVSNFFWRGKPCRKAHCATLDPKAPIILA